MRLYSWSLKNVGYSFITIILSSTLTRSGSNCKGSIYGSDRTVQSFTSDYHNWVLVLCGCNCKGSIYGSDRTVQSFTSDYHNWVLVLCGCNCKGSIYGSDRTVQSFTSDYHNWVLVLCGCNCKGSIYGTDRTVQSFTSDYHNWVLVLCEMQSVSSRIWTRIAVSISCDDKPLHHGHILWHINHCRLFNAKSSLYIYIEYIGISLVWFCGISTTVGHLMPNLLYTYMVS